MVSWPLSASVVNAAGVVEGNAARSLSDWLQRCKKDVCGDFFLGCLRQLASSLDNRSGASFARHAVASKATRHARHLHNRALNCLLPSGLFLSQTHSSHRMGKLVQNCRPLGSTLLRKLRTFTQTSDQDSSTWCITANRDKILVAASKKIKSCDS
jgi:hypothetical protein